MKKTYLLYLLLLVIYGKSLAQTELTVGDKMPPLVLNNILNSKTTAAKLQAKKNQLLLIDFWGTTCGTCIGSMPKMAALQKKWGDSINIILVSPEEKEKIEDLFRRRKEVKTIGLPIAYGDKMLRKLFPYQSVPQIVVIDDQQRIRAITFHEYITEENLNRIRRSDTATLPLKHDIIGVDYSVPFITTGLVGNEDVFFSTLFTKEIPGLSYGSGFKNNHTKFIAKNMTLRDLYESAYMRQIFILAREKNLKILVDSGVNTTDRYCFELNIQDQGNNKRNEFYLLNQMQHALDQFFGVKSKVENKTMECWVIRSNKETDTTIVAEPAVKETFTSFELINYAASGLPAYIHAVLPVNIPIVYEGHQKKQVTINFRKQDESIESVQQLLQERGFTMKMEKRESKILLVVQR
ncbi:TlpA family protein disulfide reductase [Lacibacter luteus]|uniref:TlpA family protein disulfide reductase n=1 Tax=Lacibacter luteus TaxID=2508719 RepID=A0A4Q1CJV8_9BACT|nr:TlpA disulfide reductase family protein [Lacibacter luteus]RXK60667.1 TlpA family protein disulfide reductase [Lacibacter luteus]